MKNFKKKIAGLLAAVMTLGAGGFTALAAEGDIVTEYGTIPAEYADKTFVAFSGGKALFASDYMYKNSATGVNDNIMHLAKEYMKGNKVNADGTIADGSTEVQILLMKDYEKVQGYTNLSQTKGKILIDLGGHTFNTHYNMFNAQTKAWGNHGVFETDITVKNGTIKLGAYQYTVVECHTHGNGDGKTKRWGFHFEDVDFSVKGSKAGSLVRYNGDEDKKTIPTIYDISFTDCNFNMTDAPAGFTLFKAEHEENPDITINYTVSGGSIKAPSMDGFKIADLGNANASFKYGETDVAPYYTTIVLPGNAAAPDITINDGEKTLKYEKYADNDDGTVTYAPGVVTEYGTISPQFADKAFVAFSGGKALYASDYLYDTKVDGVDTKGIVYYVKENILNGNLKSDGVLKDDAVEAQVLMLKDFTNTVAWSNIAQVRGKMTIDLNGHTLTSTTYLLATQAKPWGSITDSHIVLKNGNVVLGNYSLAYYQSHRGTSYTGTATKGYILDFDNVNISLAKDSTLTDLVKYNKANDATMETLSTDYDITFNNCTFDFKNATKKINIFSATHTAKDIYKVDCTVNGGNIIKGNYDVVMSNITATEDASFTWGKGEDSLYTTLSIPAGNVRPDVTVNVNGIDMIYDKAYTKDGYAAYKLIPSDTALIKTAYGDILPGHADENFAAFSNGRLLFTDNEIFGAGNTGIYHLAKEYMKTNTVNPEDGTIAAGAKTVVILQLHDAKISAAYSNLAQLKGSVIIDLNGKTLITAENTSVFDATAKPWGKELFDTSITMKNGKLVLNNGYLMHYNTWKGSQYTGSRAKKMAFNFEDMDISLADGYSRTAVLTYAANNLVPIDSVYDISFKDCDFDVTGAVSETLTLFKTNHTEEGTRVNLKLDGGSIKAKSAVALKVSDLADSNTYVEFIKDSETGDYTTFTLPEDAAAPREVIEANSEMMRYTKASSEDGAAVYKLNVLTDCEFLDYDIDNKAVDIAIIGDGEYSVVFADYDGDTLTGIEIVEKELAKGIQTVEQKKAFTADEIMLLDNLEDMTPLCEPKRVITVMAIGNSFAQDSVFYLDDIAAADGISLKSLNLMIGGRTLQEHCDSWDDETDPYTIQVNAGGSIGTMTIKEVAELSDWDYVMLQGTTHNTTDGSTRYDDAFWGVDNVTGEAIDSAAVWTSLRDNIAATVPGAKRFVHATWSPYEDAAKIYNYSQFAQGSPDARGAFTAASLERAQLGANIYSTEKRADGEGEFIPTAVAVDYLIRHYGFPEYEGELDENNRFSQVPDVRGVYRDKTCHLSANVGRVLAGLVWYEMITGTPATENNYERVTLSSEDMAKIKEAAHYACENYMTYNPADVDAYADAA